MNEMMDARCFNRILVRFQTLTLFFEGPGNFLSGFFVILARFLYIIDVKRVYGYEILPNKREQPD